MTEQVNGTRSGALRRGISRRHVMKAGVAAAAVMSFRLPLGAPGALAQEPVQGGVLKVAFSADPAGFDPARGPSGMSHVVIEQVYSTLMSLDPDAEPYPDLAESFEMSEDGLQLHLQAAPGRQVPQRRRADGRGREVHLRPSARPGFGLFLRLAGRDDRRRRRSSIPTP